MPKRIKIAIIGATGYVGLDLILSTIKASKYKDYEFMCKKKYWKKFKFFDKRIKKITKITKIDKIDWEKIDLFLSLPNGEAQKNC